MSAHRTAQPGQPNAYLRTKVLTATPSELRLMLLDGAIRFAEQGRAGLEQRDYEQVYNGISQCQKIVLELINGLNHEADPELCRRLSGLYTYMYMQLIRAGSEKDISRIDEVLELLRYERETWRMLMDKLAEENACAAGTADGPASTPGRDAGRGDDRCGAPACGTSISLKG